ncbi:MAG: peptidoglycan-associated lipoprotein Pal [Bdellovibrionales bacterium]|nr:peptidoglycan-associated lipoprotein Pal [Bdellovibrionales bacterium]
MMFFYILRRPWRISMRSIIVSALFCLAFLLSSCACRTKNVGAGNIPIAGEGTILKDVNFDYDSFEIPSYGREVLRLNANWLHENSNADIEIEGHCDERGTNEYNMVLGAKRAKAVMEYLRSLGVSEDRMSTVSYGEELPLDPSSNEAAWAKNRRAHFNIK